ncbi:hypothetical protein ABZX90_09720 [Streptomyces sp. NPDC002935]|uniref:hypothetical protein n=1 Tax=Streptomyces sp. NPDC002935 TaxID=3154545 RepID=UPI0033A181C1
MDQRGTTGAHTDATAVIGATTEFEPDVMDLLVETLRRAVRRELPAVGTDTLLGALVMGDTDAGAAIAPGMRKAGALSGVISGRAGRGWVSDDEVHSAPVAAGADADGVEIDAAWREARWRVGLGSRGSASKSGPVLPGMTGAMRACLLLALRSARAEGTTAVRCRHVARALLTCRTAGHGKPCCCRGWIPPPWQPRSTNWTRAPRRRPRDRNPAASPFFAGPERWARAVTA